MHRQPVDDVGPVVASLVAVVEQVRGDRVAIGLVADQDAAEVFSTVRRELEEQVTKVTVWSSHSDAGSEALGESASRLGGQ